MKIKGNQWDRKDQNKRWTNNVWILFCVGQLLLDMNLPWSMGDTPSDPLLERTDFPFPHKCQFQIASWLWVRLLCLLPLSMLGFCLVCLVCARAMFVSSYVYQSYWVLKILFPWSYPLSPTLTIFSPPLLERLLSLEVRRSIKTYHLGLSPSKSLALWMLSHCGSLC